MCSSVSQCNSLCSSCFYSRFASCRNSRKHDHPQTPDVRTKCSKRCFDGLLRAWRRRLHQWDPPSEKVDAKNESKADATTADLTKANLGEDVRFSHTFVRQQWLRCRRHAQSSCQHIDLAFWPMCFTLDADSMLMHTWMQTPVPWEDIEKMSLCTPRGSWVDGSDSDASDPESDDRETIFTNELSPTPSDLVGKSVSLFAYAAECQSNLHVPFSILTRQRSNFVGVFNMGGVCSTIVKELSFFALFCAGRFAVRTLGYTAVSLITRTSALHCTFTLSVCNAHNLSVNMCNAMCSFTSTGTLCASALYAKLHPLPMLQGSIAKSFCRMRTMMSALAHPLLPSAPGQTGHPGPPTSCRLQTRCAAHWISQQSSSLPRTQRETPMLRQLWRPPRHRLRLTRLKAC